MGELNRSGGPAAVDLHTRKRGAMLLTLALDMNDQAKDYTNKPSDLPLGQCPLPISRPSSLMLCLTGRHQGQDRLRDEEERRKGDRGSEHEWIVIGNSASGSELRLLERSFRIWRRGQPALVIFGELL